MNDINDYKETFSSLTGTYSLLQLIIIIVVVILILFYPEAYIFIGLMIFTVIFIGSLKSAQSIQHIENICDYKYYDFHNKISIVLTFICNFGLILYNVFYSFLITIIYLWGLNSLHCIHKDLDEDRFIKMGNPVYDFETNPDVPAFIRGPSEKFTTRWIPVEILNVFVKYICFWPRIFTKRIETKDANGIVEIDQESFFDYFKLSKKENENIGDIFVFTGPVTTHLDNLINNMYKVMKLDIPIPIPKRDKTFDLNLITAIVITGIIVSTLFGFIFALYKKPKDACINPEYKVKFEKFLKINIITLNVIILLIILVYALSLPIKEIFT